MFITEEMLRQAMTEICEAELETLPKPSECVHMFSHKYEKWKTGFIRKNKYAGVYAALKRVACVFLAFVLAGCLLTMANSEVRAKVREWVEERFGDYYHYFFVGEGSSGGSQSGEGLPGVTEGTEGTGNTEASGELTEYALGWVPDGYVLLDSFETDSGEMSIYVNEQGNIMQFSFLFGGDSQSLFAGYGEYERKGIDIGGIHADLLVAANKQDTDAIIWYCEERDVIFMISGCLLEDEFIKMVESLQFGEGG